MNALKTLKNDTPRAALGGRRAKSAKLLAALVISLSLALSGCSGGGEDTGNSGNSGNSGGSENSGGPPQTSQPAETTRASGSDAPEETTAGPASTSGPQETTSSRASGASGGGSQTSTALSGLEEAQSEAESWEEDAELYGIASLRASVDAEGRGEGWLYSFVSESTNSVISFPYLGGELQDTQGQELPGGQIQQISGDTLPADGLVDSPEAIERSDEVKQYLEDNPQSGARVGLDSGSSEEPEWILIVPSDEPVQEQVSATE